MAAAIPTEEDGFSGFAWAAAKDDADDADDKVPLPLKHAREVRRCAGLDAREVSARFLNAATSEPIICTDAQRTWFQQDSSEEQRWTIDSLGQRFAAEEVIVNDRAPLFDWDRPATRSRSVTLADYAAYARGDTSLLKGLWYLNTWAPFSKHPELLREWSYPYFVEDSLTHDPAALQQQLVDYSKLFLGVPGCCTRLHFDNLQTHAWLAQIQGRKRFVLYPPAADESLRLHFWEEHRSQSGGEGMRRAFDPLSSEEKSSSPDVRVYANLATTTPHVATVAPGEVLLVPMGWWHAALCLDPCVTLMRNFANASNTEPFRRAIARANDNAERLTPKRVVPGPEAFAEHSLLFWCAHCGASKAHKPIKPCSRCRAVAYCSRDCQKAHFAKHHKLVCSLLADVRAPVVGEDDDHHKKKPTTGHPSSELFTCESVAAARTFAKTVLRAGKGRFPPDPDSMVRVHYETFLADGQKVDSSRDKERPMDFHMTSTNLAKGWVDAIRTMVVGEKARVVVPPAAAYRSRGVQGKVPPDTALIFDVELLMVF